jgi:hypothetical protein
MKRFLYNSHEKPMLDEAVIQGIDDGNLETGAFQRRCLRYYYIIRDSVL